MSILKQIDRLDEDDDLVEAMHTFIVVHFGGDRARAAVAFAAYAIRMEEW